MNTFLDILRNILAIVVSVVTLITTYKKEKNAHTKRRS